MTQHSAPDREVGKTEIDRERERPATEIDFDEEMNDDRTEVQRHPRPEDPVADNARNRGVER